MEQTIKIKLEEGASLPRYQSSGASGADLCARLSAPLVLAPLERALVPTGIFLELPQGLEAQVRPRSGLALKHGITCLNSPGTIDSDYRGELKILLINLGQENFVIQHGERIAQLVIATTIQAEFVLSTELGATERSAAGFGSTGL